MNGIVQWIVSRFGRYDWFRTSWIKWASDMDWRNQQSDDFTVTGDELDLCLDRAERAEAEVERLRKTIDEDST